MRCDLAELEREAAEWSRLSGVVPSPKYRRVCREKAEAIRRQITSTRKAYAALALAHRKMEKVYDR